MFPRKFNRRISELKKKRKREKETSGRYKSVTRRFSLFFFSPCASQTRKRGKGESCACLENEQFILLRAPVETRNHGPGSKFARVNGRGSDLGWLIFQRMSSNGTWRALQPERNKESVLKSDSEEGESILLGWRRRSFRITCTLILNIAKYRSESFIIPENSTRSGIWKLL